MIPEKGKTPNCKISATDKGYQTLMPHVQWTPAPPKALPAPRAELQAAPAAAPAVAELLALPAPAGEPAAPAPVETAAATRSKRQRTTQNA